MEEFDNVQTVGRNGQFRYNNMDHSMLTALYAVDNITGAWERKIWSVNEEKAYLEEAPPADREEAPPADREDAPPGQPPVFHKIDRSSMGGALALLLGLGILMITLYLGVQQIPIEDTFMEHVAPFLPGYSLTLGGGVLGVIYGIVLGFCFGWIGAALWNLIIVAFWIAFRFNERREHLKRLLDYI